MMGFSPAQVRAMTVADFRSAVKGYRRFHCAEPDDVPSNDDYYAARAAAEAEGRA
jgi:hypothetical protein